MPRTPKWRRYRSVLGWLLGLLLVLPLACAIDPIPTPGADTGGVARDAAGLPDWSASPDVPAAEDTSAPPVDAPVGDVAPIPDAGDVAGDVDVDDVAGGDDAVDAVNEDLDTTLGDGTGVPDLSDGAADGSLSAP